MSNPETGISPHEQLGALTTTLLPQYGSLLAAFQEACRQRPDLAAAAIEQSPDEPLLPPAPVRPATVRSSQTKGRPPLPPSPSEGPPSGGAAPAAATAPQLPARNHHHRLRRAEKERRAKERAAARQERRAKEQAAGREIYERIKTGQPDMAQDLAGDHLAPTPSTTRAQELINAGVEPTPAARETPLVWSALNAWGITSGTAWPPAPLNPPAEPPVDEDVLGAAVIRQFKLSNNSKAVSTDVAPPPAPATVGPAPVKITRAGAGPGTPEHLAELQQMRTKFTGALLAENTRIGYGSDWGSFQRWAAAMKLQPLPATPETIVLFVLDELSRGLKVSSVKHKVAAIRRAHLSAKYSSPVNQEIQDILSGARRDSPDEVRQVLPITVEEIKAICAIVTTDKTPISIRNLAILLTQFGTAQRNANTAALRLADLSFSEQGVSVKLCKSKTDQEGKGRLIGLPNGKHELTCPVRALQKWIELRGAVPGPLFTRFDGSRPDRALRPERIGQIVQELIARIGLDPKLYGGHSLRSGFITATGTEGATDLNIAQQSGHASMETLRKYFRKRDAFKANPAGILDL